MKILSKSIIIFLFSIFLIQNINGQENATIATYEQQFYSAYQMNSVSAWAITLKKLEALKDENAQLLLAKGHYAAASTAIGNKDEELTKELLEKGEKLTTQFLKKNKENAEAHALMSAILGLKIGLSPMQGMFLGSKSSNHIEKALTLAPDNSFVNFVEGNSLYYTPSMFGGDSKKSIVHLEKAKNNYIKNQRTATWEYLSTMAVLGQAYHYEEDYKNAKMTYETALETAPDFGYIKKYLLPKTEKALK